jgi:hypothetical protein
MFTITQIRLASKGLGHIFAAWLWHNDPWLGEDEWKYVIEALEMAWATSPDCADPVLGRQMRRYTELCVSWGVTTNASRAADSCWYPGALCQICHMA